MRWLSQFVGLALVMIAGTWWGAWWMVPAAGAAFGLWAARERGAVLTAVLAGATTWSLFIAYTAAVGPVGRLLDLFSAMFRLSGATLAMLTVAYAALLAGSAAACARALRRLVTPA